MTTTRTVNLAQARAMADAIRARFSDPQTDPLAHALSCDALDLADEVEQLRAKRDAYRDSALMYAARVAELNDEIAKLRADQQRCRARDHRPCSGGSPDGLTRRCRSGDHGRCPGWWTSYPDHEGPCGCGCHRSTA